MFVGVDNLNTISPSTHPPHFVDKIVIHKDGYQGGMYGAYGGYDIILVKLTRPVRGHTPACLPGPRYKPSLDVKIGGYGRYRYQSCFAWKTLELNIFVRRVPCETTSGGPEVIESRVLLQSSTRIFLRFTSIVKLILDVSREQNNFKKLNATLDSWILLGDKWWDVPRVQLPRYVRMNLLLTCHNEIELCFNLLTSHVLKPFIFSFIIQLVKML